MNAKRNVIIDCDPGIDDTLALMLALKSPKLDVKGITVVCGNVPVELGVQNVFRILERCGRMDIPVCAGARTPWKREYVSAQDTHGMDGLGEAGIPAAKQGECREGAAEFLVEALKSQEKLSIIALGPLTNVADAMKLNRAAFEKLDEFVCMGGSYKSHGNCSPVAEYNFWCDPDAADYVFAHLPVKIHMVGLDVTRQIVLTPNILEYMCQIDPEEGGFIRKITRFYFDFHWKQEKVIGCVINDPLAVAYFMYPSLAEGFEAYTRVATEGISIGQSVVDAMDFYKEKSNSYVLTDVDAQEFMRIFLKRIVNAQEPELSDTLRQIFVQDKQCNYNLTGTVQFLSSCRHKPI